MPQATLAPTNLLDGNLPSVFTIRAEEFPNIWVKRPNDVPLTLVATKADIGGIGGHTETDAQVQAVGLEFLLQHNRLDDLTPLMRSFFVGHAGDDLNITAVIESEILERHREAFEGLMYDAFLKAGDEAERKGNYGPYQDLRHEEFTGNIAGSGPAKAEIALPIKTNPRDHSQTVVIAFADKTEPGAYNVLTGEGALLDAHFNTGQLIANSAMNRGYIVDIVDVDVKAQAIEAGVHPFKEKALNSKMKKLGKLEKSYTLRYPEDLLDIQRLLITSSRNVIARVWSRDENGEKDTLGVVVSTDRLHNIANEAVNSHMAEKMILFY